MVAVDGSGDRSGVRVLVVEDTPEFRQLIVEPLRREGFDVHTAEDAYQGQSLSPGLRADATPTDG
jgi:DNA-binding response OmpR family regulator